MLAGLCDRCTYTAKETIFDSLFGDSGLGSIDVIAFDVTVVTRPLSRIFQRIRLAEPFFRLISGLAEFLRKLQNWLKIWLKTTNSAKNTDKLRQLR